MPAETSFFSSREQESIAEAAAEMQAQLAHAAQLPAPAPAPVLKTFEPDTAALANEQDVTRFVNADHADEKVLRDLGRIAEADALKASREQRIAEWRASLGIPAPVTPDAATVRAAEFGVKLDAKPGDYRGADLSGFALGKDAARVENVAVELGEVMASMKLDVATGTFLMQYIAETSPKLRTMSIDDRQSWAAEQERLAASMAKARGTTLAKWVENAKRMLAGTELGRQIAGSAIIYSPTVLATLADHQKAIEKSNGK